MLALLRIPGLGEASVRCLVDAYGSASAILELRRPPTRIRLSEGIRGAIVRARPLSSREVRLPPRTRLAVYGSPGYPHVLRRLVRPPLILYLRGPRPLTDDRTVAIVGTRRASAYGRRVAGKIAFDLANAGFSVVSGLARGIDAAAHRGALDAGGSTIGVLGCGFDHVYPASSRDLHVALGERGLLVTEHEADVRPAPYHFPRRNRIIAALSRAVVVVQAGLPSGALITVDHALDLGLEVFAVPGPVDEPGSRGVHRLLREGAMLATGAGDILSALEAPRAWATIAGMGRDGTRETAAGGHLAGRLVDRLGDAIVPLDDLVRDLGVPVPDLLAALGRLELEGAVTALPGQRFRIRGLP